MSGHVHWMSLRASQLSPKGKPCYPPSFSQHCVAPLPPKDSSSPVKLIISYLVTARNFTIYIE